MAVPPGMAIESFTVPSLPDHVVSGREMTSMSWRGTGCNPAMGIVALATRRSRAASLLAGAVAFALMAVAPPAQAQLTVTAWRSDTGQVFQVLQHRAGDDRAVGIDEVRVTSIAANSGAAHTCGSPPMFPGDGTSLEALASGPLSGGQPLDLAYKSRLIADASAPCFSSAAEDGTGRVCIGPACDSDCACAEGAACETFVISDGVALGTATPETPAAYIISPLQIRQTHCQVSNDVTIGFGTSTHLTTRTEICAPAPADGLRLAGSPSAFDGGTPGTTVILVFNPDEGDLISVAAAGFGIDTDGQNPFDCDAPGRVVAALMASGDGGSTTPPPTPPVDLVGAELACQQAVARAGRRFTGKVLRVLQKCRDRILNRTWAIEAARCGEQPSVVRAITAAAHVARSGISARCQRLDMSRLLACGDSTDDLITPDGASGCLYDSHRNLAELLAIVEYGF